MPTVNVDKEHFYQALGKQYTTKEFDELCFQFGIELDDDTTEEVKGTDVRPQLKIDIPANRYDLLCQEGISRSLRVFLGKMKQPSVKVVQPASLIECHVKESVAKVRPFVACAVLRNITFTPENYANFIDLQDKLHQNLARRRTLVSMGTHDLDTISGPFTYEGLPPKDISFAPLNRPGEVMDGEKLMAVLEGDRHLKAYLPIIRDSPLYPVILDKDRTVCSLPPIINSEHSKITLKTKNVFIDMTAVDETKMHIALNILVAMFAEYCAEPFTVEPVKVTYPDGRSYVSPDMAARRTTARISYINSCTGLGLDGPGVVESLRKMGHEASFSADKPDEVVVDIPCTRPDVMHECDLMEDVAVAYGFDNLPRRFPSTNTVAAPLPINKLTDIIRRECAYSGWIEVLPLILCSHDENFRNLRRKDDGTTAIVLENPATAEYQVVRTSLLPGILKTLRENRRQPLPIRLFESSDVAFKDEKADPERCARNERHVTALYCDKTASFEVVHGLLDKLMRSLGVSRIAKGDKGKERGYYIAESENPTFFPGRAAAIFFRRGSAPVIKADALPEAIGGRAGAADDKEGSGNGPLSSMASSLGQALGEAASKVGMAGGAGAGDIEIGQLGALHPEVLKAFDIEFPVSAIEFNLEPFL